MRRTLLVAVSLLLATPTLALVAPASARPTHLPPQPVFGATATEGYPTSAVAPDGTVVVGREDPGPTGRLLAQVRRPAGRWGPTTTLATDAPGAEVANLDVHAGPDGTLAATWYAEAAASTVVSFLRPGSAAWSSPRPTGLSASTVVLDAAGRAWVAGGTGQGTVVRVVGATGDSRSLQLPAPADGFYDSGHVLAPGPDSTARLALVRSRSTVSGDPVSPTCAVQSELWTAELRLGATPSTSRLEQHFASTTSPGCFPYSGPQLTGLDLERVGGVDTLISTTTDFARETTVSRSARTGQPWPTSATRVLPPGAGLVQAAVVGGRVVVLARSTEPAGLVLVVRSGGRWSAPRRLTSTTELAFVSLAGSAGGGLVAYLDYADPYRVVVHALGRTGSPGVARAVPASASGRLGEVGVDARGDGGLLSVPAQGSRADFLAYDGVGPRVSALSVPTRAVAGGAVRLRARAADTWSSVARYTWTAGGRRLSGPDVRVRLAAGRQRVALSVTDRVGNTTVLTRTVLVSRTA